MKAYLLTTGVLFSLIALLHAARLFWHLPAQLGGWEVPLGLSWAGLLVSGALSVWAFMLARTPPLVR